MRYLKTVLTLFVLLQFSFCIAQTGKDMEAIAKYQLAEEAYSNMEYDKALGYLEEAQGIVGRVPKLLYLQIAIEMDKGYTSTTRVSSILSLIDKFEKSNDVSNFSEQKKLLVAKNKVLLNEKLREFKQLEEKSKEQKKEQELRVKRGKENFDKFTIDDLPLGLTIEEFQARYPKVWAGNYKVTKTKWQASDDPVYVYHPKNIDFEDKASFLWPYNSSSGAPLYDSNIFAFFVKNGKVVGFQKNLFYYNSKGQGNLDYAAAVDQIRKCSAAYSADFESYGQTATDAISHVSSANQWSWEVPGDKKVTLTSDQYIDQKNPRRWKCSLIVSVYKDCK